MKLHDFNPGIDPASLEDHEVVGLLDRAVIHFNAQEGTVYEAGLDLEDWLNGHGDAWCMTEVEAGRVGIADYAAYEARLRDLNPGLLGEMRTLSVGP